MGITVRAFIGLVVTFAFWDSAAWAQASFSAPLSYTMSSRDGAAGLTLGRGLVGSDCPATMLVCLVGRAKVSSSLGFYGKVGPAYARTETSVMGNMAAGGPEPGYGVGYAGGFSWDFTPRVSATVEWGSYDLRLAGGPVRSTSLGLQVRY